MKFGEYDFRTFTLGTGSHESRDKGMCVMEAVAYVAGEPHSDHPECACPVISAFLRSWNDGITDDNRRRELLSQFVFRLPGTKATPEIELRRVEMCLDWLVREAAPLALELVPSLVPHAESLRSMPEITMDNIDSVVLVVQSERSAAWDAAGSAAGAAAWAAAGDAAGAAAGDAAGDAAWAAAWAAGWAAAWDAAGAAGWAAGWAAAWDAAWTAAWDAAWDAAGDAAGAALQGVVCKCQESAVTLIDRMLRLTEKQEAVDSVKVTVTR